jgi:hypothetical protein
MVGWSRPPATGTKIVPSGDHGHLVDGSLSSIACVPAPDDAAEPAWKGRRIGKAGQRGPRRPKGLLGDVLALVKLAHQGERRAESKILECRVSSTKDLTSPPIAQRTRCSSIRPSGSCGKESCQRYLLRMRGFAGRRTVGRPPPGAASAICDGAGAIAGLRELPRP